MFQTNGFRHAHFAVSLYNIYKPKYTKPWTFCINMLGVANSLLSHLRQSIIDGLNEN